MKGVVIIGAGDLGKEVVWLIEDINKQSPTYFILGFLDADEEKIGHEFYGYKVLGNDTFLEELSNQAPIGAVIAIQDGSIRKRIVDQHPMFDSWETIVHPFAVIASSSRVGKGSIVFPHVTISVDNRLGAFNLYYTNSIICNDCIIGDYVSIMAGASVSERAQIGNESFLAAGCTIYPHKVLGNNVRVDIEATANKDYRDHAKISEKKFLHLETGG